MQKHPVKTTHLVKGHSSAITDNLIGNTKKYSQIMHECAIGLQRRYPNKKLAQTFKLLPRKIITLCPMVLCDSLAGDLGIKAPKEVLAAIGLSCFTLSAHDDAVDETPAQRSQLASLIYAGNLTTLKATEILLASSHRDILDVVLEEICENHFRQQLRVDLLWERKPRTFTEYKEGIRDLHSLTAVGPLCAIALAKKQYLKRQVQQFAIGYGVALQIIDDIREVDEDRLLGYNSYPLREGPPFTMSFTQLRKHLDLAHSAIEPGWKLLASRVEKTRSFAQQLQHELTK